MPSSPMRVISRLPAPLNAHATDLGLWKDEQIPAFISLVSSLRALSPGLTVGMQLGHAGRKSSTFPPFQRLPRKHEHWAEEDEGGWPKDIVAPSAVPHGKHAAGTPLKNLVPRTPLGPSDNRSDGTPCCGSPLVCQKSIPGRSRRHREAM